MALPKLSNKDVKGVWAIMSTPAKENASSWSAEDTVNLEEAASLAEKFVVSRADAIMLNGTFGEGATLTWEELKAFTDTVIQVVRGRVPVFAGATTLNTRDTIKRAKELGNLGATGLFLGRPMWIPLDDVEIIQYYKDIAEALPHLNIVVYDNPSAFKGKISPQVYAEIGKLPQVIASKHVGLSLGEAVFKDVRAAGDKIRFLPTETGWFPIAKLIPEHFVACWSGFYGCGPASIIALKESILAKDFERAEKIHLELEYATEKFFPGGDFNRFFQYSIQIDNLRFKGAGWYNPGPTRPPYTYLPDEYIEGALETGRRWKALHEKYSREKVELV